MSNSAVEAELAIRNLLARMAQLADSEETLEEYLTLFAEDASWTMLASPSAANQESVEYRGRAEILAGALSRRSQGIQGPGSNVLHDLTTIAVTIEDEGRARSVAYFKFFGSTNDQPKLLLMGQYVDTFERRGGIWQLTSRIIVPA